MSGCQKNKTEIMLDGQDTVSESETQDDTQAGNDATEDLAEAKISAEAELSEMPVETEPEMIFVDVCGAVMNPGVYELDGSSRVFQAIEAAGGFLPEAAASAVNQAQPVSDGQQIYVPTQEEAEEGALPAAIQPVDPGSESTDANGVVNINTADASDLRACQESVMPRHRQFLRTERNMVSFPVLRRSCRCRESKKVRFRR